MYYLSTSGTCYKFCSIHFLSDLIYRHIILLKYTLIGCLLKQRGNTCLLLCSTTAILWVFYFWVVDLQILILSPNHLALMIASAIGNGMPHIKHSVVHSDSEYAVPMFIALIKAYMLAVSWICPIKGERHSQRSSFSFTNCAQ